MTAGERRGPPDQPGERQVREGEPVVLPAREGRAVNDLAPTVETDLPSPRPRDGELGLDAARLRGRVRRRRGTAERTATLIGSGERRVPAATRPAPIDAPTVVEDPLVKLDTVTDTGLPQPRGAQPAAPPPAPVSSEAITLPPESSASAASDAQATARGSEAPEILLPPDLMAGATSVQLALHQHLFRERDPGAGLYVLRSGMLELAKWERSPRQARVGLLGAGACLGELALLGDGTQHLAAKALEPCELALLPTAAVRALMTRDRAVERQLRALYRARLQEVALRASPLLEGLERGEAASLLARMRPLRLAADKQVISEGGSASGLHLVLLGSLRVTRRKGEADLLLGILEDGDFFGEMSLLTGRPACASVATTGFVQALRLAPEEFAAVAAEHPALRRVLEAEAERRGRVTRAIMRGTARFDEERRAAVYLRTIAPRS